MNKEKNEFKYYKVIVTESVVTHYTVTARNKEEEAITKVTLENTYGSKKIVDSSLNNCEVTKIK